jgi:hypothetical protein
MTRRWIFRRLFLALVVMMLATWGGSYFQKVVVCRVGGATELFSGINSGLAYVSKMCNTARGAGGRWTWGHDTADSLSISTYQHHLAGFGYEYRSFATGTYEIVLFPLWLPAGLAALCLWAVWRKTRSKGSGFPVEPAAKLNSLQPDSNR